MDSGNSVGRAANRQRMLLNHLRSDMSRATEAVSQLQLNPTSAGDSAPYERRASSLNDVVIVCALRTPVCKAKRGGFKDTHADDLLAAVLKAVLQQTGVEPQAVGDIVVGSVLGPSSQRANESRIAMFLAGFPETVPVRTVNRQCSSGLQAIADVAAAIQAGYYTIGIGAGVETMSINPMAWEGGVNPKVETCPAAGNCLLPMGVTSENVAARYGVSRDTQDKFAAQSHARMAAAQQAGKFDREIVPVATKLKDPKSGEEHDVVISRDDGVRPGTSAASLAKLRPVFKKDGSTTAGNSSQVSDGAAASLLMTRREALRRGLPILGIWRGFSAVGVPPEIMGIGPSVAIPDVVRRGGISIEDVDVFEVNEAFASQATYCCDVLDLDPAKVNPNGGAIAMGHPLGATGARATATLLHEMARRGKAARFGIVSMCIGSGMGAAALFEAGGEADNLRNAGQVHAQSNLSRDAMV